MPQLEFWPDDEGSTAAFPQLTPTPAELEAIRQHEQERQLETLSTSEDRQRHYARIADEQRRAARESRARR